MCGANLTWLICNYDSSKPLSKSFQLVGFSSSGMVRKHQLSWLDYNLSDTRTQFSVPSLHPPTAPSMSDLLIFLLWKNLNMQDGRMVQWALYTHSSDATVVRILLHLFRLFLFLIYWNTLKEFIDIIPFYPSMLQSTKRDIFNNQNAIIIPS